MQILFRLQLRNLEVCQVQPHNREFKLIMAQLNMRCKLLMESRIANKEYILQSQKMMQKEHIIIKATLANLDSRTQDIHCQVKKKVFKFMDFVI